MAWTDIAANPAVAIEGLLVDAPPGGTNSYIAEAAVRAGFLVAYGTDRLAAQNQVAPLPALPVADVDSIALTVVSAVAVQNLTAAADLDGVIGLGRIYPPQAITINFDAVANWDTLLGYLPVTIYGDDAEGNPIQETLIRNNAGAVAVAVEGHQVFSRVRQIDVGASNGAGGNATVGTTPNYTQLSVLDYPGVACYDMAREPSATVAVTFDVDETLACVREGLVWAVCVDGCTPGEPVHVRTIAGGGVLRGALYGPQPLPAGAAFAPLIGASWVTAAAALGLAQLRIGG